MAGQGPSSNIGDSIDPSLQFPVSLPPRASVSQSSSRPAYQASQPQASHPPLPPLQSSPVHSQAAPHQTSPLQPFQPSSPVQTTSAASAAHHPYYLTATAAPSNDSSIHSQHNPYLLSEQHRPQQLQLQQHSPVQSHLNQQRGHRGDQGGPPELSPESSARHLDPALGEPSPGTHPVSGGEDEDHEDDHGSSELQSLNSPTAGGRPRPRACDSCRNLKVRCIQGPSGRPCARCAKAQRQCVTSAPVRKRQKKSDSRVAALERQINELQQLVGEKHSNLAPALHPSSQPSYQPALGASFQQADSFRHDAGDPWSTRGQQPPPGYHPAENIQPDLPTKRKRLNEFGEATISENMEAFHRDLAENPENQGAIRHDFHVDHSNISGLIDRIVHRDAAERIFNRYVKDICPHFPAVPLPPGATADEVRQHKPLLFLAILAGSCHGSAEPLVFGNAQRKLTDLLKEKFANIIWRDGEKSLEIVQALHLMVLWYRPPAHFEQHNFYMMVNCAAVMALDLGLGRRKPPNTGQPNTGPLKRGPPDPCSLEARRTFLVCYYLCMSITMILRRPILLRWTSFMDESVQVLEKDGFDSDKILVQHVKMAHIGEKISHEFCLDDPCSQVGFNDPKVSYLVKVFENDLQKIKDQDALLPKDPALTLAEHVTALYIHEIAINQNQSPAEFKPPFSHESLQSSVCSESVTHTHLGALGCCVKATHGVLDAALSVKFATLVTMPVIFCVRTIYAIVCLMKIWAAAKVSSKVGAIINPEELKLESYTDRLIALFADVVKRDPQTPHGKFLFVAQRLREKFSALKDPLGASGSEGEVKGEPSHAAQGSGRPESSSNQTPLHLLSEVAMGSSAAPSNCPQQQPIMQQLHPLQPLQAQQALQNQQQQHRPQQPQQPQHPQQSHQQPPHSQQQQAMPGWYDGTSMLGPSQPHDIQGMPQGYIDPNFDLANFDFTAGDTADLSALLMPGGMACDYGYMPPYNGGFPPPNGQF